MTNKVQHTPIRAEENERKEKRITNRDIKVNVQVQETEYVLHIKREREV